MRILQLPNKNRALRLRFALATFVLFAPLTIPHAGASDRGADAASAAQDAQHRAAIQRQMERRSLEQRRSASESRRRTEQSAERAERAQRRARERALRR